MRIEDLPLIKNLESFANKLPREHRVELYDTALTFYQLGVGIEAMVDALNLVGVKPTENKIALWQDYLFKKAKESREAKC